MLKAALVLATALDFNAAVVEMERAVILGDESALERITSELRVVLDDDDASHDPRLPYAIAYASWRLSNFHERGSKQSKELLKDAEKLLKDILDDNAEDAEAQALYGTVNGGLITGMWSGMRRGPRSDKAYQRAREADPGNPRAAMQQGSSRLFRPGAFGGGVDKAEAELTEAMALFEAEPRDKPWPNSGHAEIRAWMGMVMQRKGELDKARQYYDEALAMEPDYYWVKEILLPELDAAVHESSTQIH